MSDTGYTYVETTGLIVPDTSTVLTQIDSEFTGVWPGMDMDASTPQGLLATAETLARSNVLQNNAVVANQINPNLAGGVFLEAIAALTGLVREPDTYTAVQGVLLTGQQGSPIPAGALAATTAGDQFSLDSEVELDPVTGQGTGNFTAVQPGPIPCGSGSAGLTTLITGVLGWETVSNTEAGVLGTLAQPDEPFRILRRNTLALQGVALIEAILSAVSALSGVIGRQGLENYTSAPQTISGVYLLANSIWVCVDGGTQADIATALLLNKSMGCNWNGAQSVAVIEPVSGQVYNVQYDVPTIIDLLVQVNVKQGTFVGDPTIDVTQAVVDFSNNAVIGLQGFSVGESASPFDIAAAILQECPGLYVRSVLLSLTGGTPVFLPQEIAMQLFQKARAQQGNITVNVVT